MVVGEAEGRVIDFLSLAACYFLATRLPAPRPVEPVLALPGPDPEPTPEPVPLHPDDQASELVNWFWTPRTNLRFPEEDLEVGRCFEWNVGGAKLLLLYDYLDRATDICWFTVLHIEPPEDRE
jgi:hypothetical protein